MSEARWWHDLDVEEAIDRLWETPLTPEERLEIRRGARVAATKMERGAIATRFSGMKLSERGEATLNEAVRQARMLKAWAEQAEEIDGAH